MEKFLFVLLLIRALCDSFSSVTLGPLKLNIPAIWGLIFLFFGIFYLVRRQKILFHPIMRFFILWIVFLFFNLIVSYVNFSSNGFALSLRELIRIITLFFSFLVFYNINNKFCGKFIKYVFLALIVPVVIGLY